MNEFRFKAEILVGSTSTKATDLIIHFKWVWTDMLEYAQSNAKL